MDDTSQKIPRFCSIVDGLIRKVGIAVAWLNVLLIINILVQVIFRYAFSKGYVWMEELQWHLYGTAIVFAISYCITENSHIRLDLFHRKFSPKKKEVVEVVGIILMLFPLYIILSMHGIGFVESALRVHERSESPLGLPFRWIIKSMVPISMFLVVLAASSRLVRSLSIIFHKNKDIREIHHGN